MVFVPRFSYTHSLTKNIGMIEGARAVIDVLPLPPDTTLRLRHDALQRSTRNSTQIEGNPLDEAAMRQAIAQGGRQRSDAEQEVRNYWRALDRVEEFSETQSPITEAFIQELHRIVIVRSRGRRGSRSQYRTTECPVVDSVTRSIDYAPPEPQDVPVLMKDLTSWLSSPAAAELPTPIRAGILTHRFLSIHPFDDGNGRTGRLLATAELWRSSYRMRGFFSFDEYFNADRDRYYRSLQMGLPVNFYEGRHDPDYSPWLEYFVEILALAAKDLQKRATLLYQARNIGDVPWDELSRRQQQMLTRLLARVLADIPEPLTVRPADVEAWFGVSDRTAREWLGEWSSERFMEPVLSGQGVRIREYQLAEPWASFLTEAKSTPQNSGTG
ncbi:MAG: Fic family protein [Synechococcales bacterium]|nr:Fic family protein [Synechococcales bacterium]